MTRRVLRHEAAYGFIRQPLIALIVSRQYVSQVSDCLAVRQRYAVLGVAPAQRDCIRYFLCGVIVPVEPFSER
jgi:hypothetical protein